MLQADLLSFEMNGLKMQVKLEGIVRIWGLQFQDSHLPHQHHRHQTKMQLHPAQVRLVQQLQRSFALDFVVSVPNPK
jgi:hypothetical protein